MDAIVKKLSHFSPFNLLYWHYVMRKPACNAMKYAYHPDVAAKAVNELAKCIGPLADNEYANALLSDARMTHTKGLLASCGFSYKGIKFIRDRVSGNIPTLEAQKRVIAFLNTIDEEQQQYEEVAA